MRTLIFVVSLALLAATQPAQAQTVEGAYDLAAIPFNALNAVCSPCGPDLHYGGHTFPALGLVPAHVAIRDALGGPVAFLVCQDHNADLLCGGNLEPFVRGCGTELSLLDLPSRGNFRADKATTVFVYAVQNPCNNVALRGTIALTYVA